VQATQLIGLDIGQKRTGVARASSIARLAEPLMTIETDQIIPKLEDLVNQLQPAIVVVGLPRSLQSNDTAQTKWVQSLTASLKSHFSGIDFKFQDEALTTVAASERLAKNTTEIDAMAASIILQDFLDEQISNQTKDE
jgi:putative holliday junction resolvase